MTYYKRPFNAKTFRQISCVKPLLIIGLIAHLSLAGCSSIQNLLNKGDDQALENAGPIIPEDAKLDFAKAAKAMEQEDFDAALKLLRGLQTRHPSFSGPWLNEGVILVLQKKCDQAIPILQKTIQINPQNKHGFNQLGLCLREAGQFKEAKEAYSSALKVDPNYSLALYNLAILEELYLQDIRSALEHFQQYQSLQAEPQRKVKGWIKDLERRVSKLVDVEPTPVSVPNEPNKSNQKVMNDDASTRSEAIATIPTTQAAPTSQEQTDGTINTQVKGNALNDDFPLELESETAPTKETDNTSRSSIWR